MEIKIYQINPDRDRYRVLFLAYEYLEKLQENPEPDSTIYDMVFAGDVDTETLEGVYRIFNTKRMPVNYNGRSLSVSDIVQVISGGKMEPGFYYCDSFGFKEVPFERKEL